MRRRSFHLSLHRRRFPGLCTWAVTPTPADQNLSVATSTLLGLGSQLSLGVRLSDSLIGFGLFVSF